VTEPARPAHRLNPRSLRYRALVVVVAVVMGPLVMVWCSGISEDGEVRRLEGRLAASVGRAAASPPAELEAVARAEGVRLRVVDDDGQVMVDHDYAEDPRWLDELRDPLVWGPGDGPRLADHDRQLGPLALRPEVLAATAEPAARCEVASGQRLLLCAAAVRRDDGRVVHLMVGSSRALRSLYEDRFQLGALTSLVLSAGIALALWVGWRMVRPIESLRDQVVERAAGRARGRPVRLERNDELGDLARAFNELLTALEARNRSNAAFAADLAHELKNPVAAVRAAAEALDSERPVDGRRRERLQRVLADASRRMTTVTDRFLELARAEAGLQDSAREAVSLDELVRALVAPMRADPRFEGVDFEVTGSAPAVVGVPERLETAVRNLLHNAGEYAAPDGSVQVTLDREGPSAVVRVRDSGPGIPEADLPRVFDRYFTTRDGGTGLGLALAKAIAEAHGGHLRAASPGGAEFTMVLPADPVQ